MRATRETRERTSTLSTEEVHSRLDVHRDTAFGDPARVRALSQAFRREGYVKIRDLVPDDIKAMVEAEVRELVAADARRIDLLVEATGNTPRKMSTVSRASIDAAATVIPAVYESPAVMSILSEIAAEPAVLCPWEDERYVIIAQTAKGDTHGWHWGDFPFTVIWVLEAPPTEFGGMLQCIPHTNWDKFDPKVHDYLVANPIRTYAHGSGDLYFLKSDTTLHRTVPLTEDKTRIILNTCWGRAGDVKERTHETMNAMFE